MDPNIEKILKLPAKQKLAILLLVVIAIGAGFFFGLQQPKLKELKAQQDTLAKIHDQVQEKKKIADQLPKYRAEYAKLQKDLDSALTELPNQKEIPSLLTSITNVGKAAGLDFLLFRPKPEVAKGFYAEVPVDIIVSGGFMNIANFFIAVGNLPRIVNIGDVNFADIKYDKDKGRTNLRVTCLATTFRFLDKKEIKDDKKKK
ncbi:type 4a pilus biogenesis protein PilO [Geobacter pelophilus]|uniref:Type 4a pilus biogenesis protein PilO n=1 Tax=Geoanaerobacter pelophilus TaxID=60036 RepID=A0AAW4LC82_9BACT|nr:type 4a pilus biogenesis protein PilO [Geoanaerobacter pelophilus]MBT0665634.1 type 4a pilus biogenesis protein PilO [Geoanaerobacter pelophilus]